MPRDVPHVTTIEQMDGNAILVHVETGSFQPGQEVEVSVYLTQGDAYAAHYEKKRIPLPDLSKPGPQPAELHVELPATELDAGQEVTVVTRVAEVWPTVLQPDSATVKQYKLAIQNYPSQGLKAAWKYRDDEDNEDNEGN